jgi:hypothetical protein
MDTRSPITAPCARGTRSGYDDPIIFPMTGSALISVNDAGSFARYSNAPYAADATQCGPPDIRLTAEVTAVGWPDRDAHGSARSRVAQSLLRSSISRPASNRFVGSNQGRRPDDLYSSDVGRLVELAGL